MQIEGRNIGAGERPYVIAEISSNHLGDVERACRLVEAAAATGADAVKIQTFDADALTIDCDRPEFIVRTPPWAGMNYYQLYREIALPAEHTGRLFQAAREAGVTLFSSPFDERAVELLARLNCPAYKIASFEANDDPLLRAVAATGKPVIVSTGVSSQAEIRRTLAVLQESGCREPAFLHCVSEYPARTSDMNLRALDWLASLGCPVGLSDHTLDNLAAVVAVARGASIIEKHFTLRRADGGPDAAFSLEPAEFGALVAAVRGAFDALGDADVLAGARPGAQHARSLFVVRAVARGAVLTGEDVRAIRPGLGLPPRALESVLGRRARRDIARGEPLRAEDIE